MLLIGAELLEVRDFGDQSGKVKISKVNSGGK